MRLARMSADGLKGLSHFASGVELDLSPLPAGLLALTGPNGSGKTTVLELLVAALYTKFPSRPDCAIADAADGRDAFIDVTVEDGPRGYYRARVNIDSVSRRVDAVLERTAVDGTTQRLNDGKVSTFRQAVAAEFPSLALLLASAFAAQNKEGSFATLDRAGRRQLFSELLGLAEYETRAQTAGECARLVDRRLAVVTGAIDQLRPTTTDEQAAELERERARLADALSAALDEESAANARAQALTRTVDEARTAAEQHTTARAQCDAQEAARTRLALEAKRLAAETEQLNVEAKATRAAIDGRRQSAIAFEEQQIAQLVTEAALDRRLAIQLAGIDDALARLRADRERRITANEELLANADTIRKSAELLPVAKARRQQAIQSADAAVRLQLERGRDLDARKLQHARLDRAQADLDTARNATAILDRVPCGGQPPYDGCELLQAARATRDTIPQLEARITERRRLEAEIDAAADAVQQARQAVEVARAHVDACDHDVAALEPVASQLPHLEAAESRVAEHRHAIAEAEREAEVTRESARQARVDAWTARNAECGRRESAIAAAADAALREHQALDARVAERRAELHARGAAIATELRQIDEHLTALRARIEETRTAHQALQQAEADLATAQQHLRETSSRVFELEFDQRANETALAAFQARRAERVRLEAAAAALRDDLVIWQAFARIFGREGLPVLEIDAAGPGVSALANDLLQACFGARFTVELVTQVAKVSGDGTKEVFELRVFDSERGGEAKDLALYSGGEQVVINEALRCAVALFVNQRNERPFRTIFRDETTGALDPDNALRYVQMLRRLQERSGAAQILYVTHSTAAAALADCQLRFSDEGLSVAYPPFQEVA